MAGNPKRRARREALGLPVAARSDKPAKGAGIPAPPGNTLARMGAGHRSARVFRPVAEALSAGLVADRPALAGVPEALAAWSVAEARCWLLRQHLDQVGVIDPGTGEPRTALLKWASALEAQAARHRERLGLDPLAEARLHRWEALPRRGSRP